MAKRVGNVATVVDLREQGIDGAVYRHFNFNAHYRKQLNLADDSLEQSAAAVRRIGSFARRLSEASGGTAALTGISTRAEAAFRAALFDDLNAPEALAALFTFISEANRELDAKGTDTDALAEARRVFGVMDGVLDLVPASEETDTELATWVEERLAARRAARADRDFATSDAIRAELVARGVQIEDTAQGTKWRVG
jgi:cysteinyl-tRNA synthetase